MTNLILLPVPIGEKPYPSWMTTLSLAIGRFPHLERFLAVNERTGYLPHQMRVELVWSGPMHALFVQGHTTVMLASGETYEALLAKLARRNETELPALEDALEKAMAHRLDSDLESAKAVTHAAYAEKLAGQAEKIEQGILRGRVS